MFGFGGAKKRAEQIAQQASTFIAVQKFKDFEKFFNLTDLRSSLDLQKFDLYLNSAFVFYLYVWLQSHPDKKFVDHFSNALTQSTDREISLAVRNLVEYAPMEHPNDHIKVAGRWLAQKLGLAVPSEACITFLTQEAHLQANNAYAFIYQSMPEMARRARK